MQSVFSANPKLVTLKQSVSVSYVKSYKKGGACRCMTLKEKFLVIWISYLGHQIEKRNMNLKSTSFCKYLH